MYFTIENVDLEEMKELLLNGDRSNPTVNNILDRGYYPLGMDHGLCRAFDKWVNSPEAKETRKVKEICHTVK